MHTSTVHTQYGTRRAVFPVIALLFAFFSSHHVFFFFVSANTTRSVSFLNPLSQRVVCFCDSIMLFLVGVITFSILQYFHIYENNT
jgi:hypothetical protein